MALHTIPASMLKESLDETLEAAKFCCEYKKTEDKWEPYNTGGCLGYPAGVLLFSIIDSIGSYYRKNTAFKVEVDSKVQSINADGWEHFKILNSKYFKQKLSAIFLKALYNKFRSNLTHNSVLGKDALMIPCNASLTGHNIKDVVFCMGKDAEKNDKYLIFIQELYELCVQAVQEFKKDIDEVVPASKQGNKFH